MLSDSHFKIVKYFENSKDVFDTVEIKGGVAITYRDANTVLGAIEMFVSHSEQKSIYEKVRQKENVFLNTIIASQGLYRFSNAFFEDYPDAKKYIGAGTGNKIVSSVMDKIPNAFYINPPETLPYIRMMGYINNRRDYRYIAKKYVQGNDYLDKFNVFLPEANGTGTFGETLTPPTISSPGEGSADSYLSAGMFELECEAIHFLQYFKTKFFRTLLGMKKGTHHCPPGVWEMIPMQDFSDSSDIDWKKSVSDIDKQLYLKYNLSNEEISFIETHVKSMDKPSIEERLLGSSYGEIVKFLLKKYGPAKHNYYKDTNCTEKNHKVSRTDEGLYCHHIDEDKAILLSNDRFAANNPFDYQKANRLVYCNLLEHLLLHVKIAENPSKEANKNELPGIGGAIAFLCKELNDIYAGKEPEEEWRKKVVEKVKDNFNDYITVLRYLWNVVENNPLYKSIITKKMLCVGYDGKIVPKVLKALNGEETEE